MPMTIIFAFPGFVVRRSEEPCAMPMCSTRCPAGYATDERGCITCRCKDTEEETSSQQESSEVREDLLEEEEEDDEEVCQDHPCPDAHLCVAITLPMCQLITQATNNCDKKPMCLRKSSSHFSLFSSNGDRYRCAYSVKYM
jgi:hypothetical protein